MNIYLAIILIAILAEFILAAVSRRLNLQSLTTILPEEFDGFYDADEYARSQEYTRTNSRFGSITSSFDLIVILLFILLGGFNAVDIFIRQFGYSDFTNGLLYFGLLMILQDCISTPFSIYSQFVIEDKFGFNKMTWKLFIADKLKGYMILLILGTPVIGLILYFFEKTGDLAWLYAWIMTSALSIIIQPLYVNFIAPLFNKFTPVGETELGSAIDDYLKQINFPVSGVFMMDGSKRSAHSNAYFTGFGRFKRVVLYDTLVDKHSVPEIVTMLAHEVGHYRKKHIIKGLITGILHTGLLFFLLSLFLSNRGLFDAFSMQNISIYAGMIFFIILYTPVEMIISILMNIISRKHEYEADAFAARTTNNPEAMILALKNLSTANLGNLTPHPFSVFLNYSHPPVLERIKALRNLKLKTT